MRLVISVDSLIDLLKYISALGGYRINIEGGTNEVSFIKTKDMINDIGSATDLSDNLESFEIKSLHPNMSQRNYMRYSNDENVGIIGEGYIDISDDTLPREQDFYVAPFSASNNEKWNDLIIGRYPIIKIWNEEFEDIAARLFKLRLEAFDPVLNITAGGGDTTTASKYVAYWQPSQGVDNIIAANYQEYIAMLNNFKMIDGIIYLSDEEFNALDLSKIAYIKQLGSYFIINIVPDYVSGQVVSIDLIKL
jgi:hypothetical protein